MSDEQLRAENADLRARLEEAEETLRAIREGEVDAVIVTGSKGDRVFALSEAENLSRLMVETMAEAGLAVTTDGLLVFCNDRACDALGRPRDQLLGHDVGQFVAPSDADRFRELLRTTTRGVTGNARIAFLAASGATLPMHMWTSYLDRPDNALICLVATDLSRLEADRELIVRLQAQQRELLDSRRAAVNLMKDAVAARQEAQRVSASLHASEQRFRLALRNAPVSVAVQDRDLRYIWAYNQKAARPEEIIGHTDEDFLNPEEAARVAALKRRVLEEGIELREGLWFDRPGGRLFLDMYWEPLRDAEGRVIGVGSATVDLTPLKLAEEQIQRQIEELRASNEELVRFNQVMVDRELRMIELKKEINALLAKQGMAAKYEVAGE